MSGVNDAQYAVQVPTNPLLIRTPIDLLKISIEVIGSLKRILKTVPA